MSHTSLRLVEAICDHFVTTKTTYGWPDPAKTAFAGGSSTAERISPTKLHSPPAMALALCRAGARLHRQDYVQAADLYALYLIATVRDPVGGRWDLYSESVARAAEAAGRSIREQARYLMSRSWMQGITLDVLCRGFMTAHPDETSFLSKACALYDWLQHFRTERGPHFKIGYTPSGLPPGQDVDGAFSDDLGLVGRGLASYYAVSGREDVLKDLIGLAGYYLRPHRENCDDGCFSEDLGSWVICPWALELRAEHIQGEARADRLCWGFSNREAIDFLTRLYGWTDDEDLRRRIRARAVSGMKWAFDVCQFEDGAIGMMGRDDAFAGMAGAVILNFLDCVAAGLLSQEETTDYGIKARKAMDWLCSWSPDDVIQQAGHRQVNGGVSLNPPENLAWMLSWAVEALLREDELKTSG